MLDKSLRLSREDASRTSSMIKTESAVRKEQGGDAAELRMSEAENYIKDSLKIGSDFLSSSKDAFSQYFEINTSSLQSPTQAAEEASSQIGMGESRQNIMNQGSLYDAGIQQAVSRDINQGSRIVGQNIQNQQGKSEATVIVQSVCNECNKQIANDIAVNVVDGKIQQFDNSNVHQHTTGTRQ
jgi:membrane-associated HD superfamily phosphohydrolase